MGYAFSLGARGQLRSIPHRHNPGNLLTSQSMNTLPLLQNDPILDASGFTTLRPYDGSANGELDVQPIATVYDAAHAAEIVRRVNLPADPAIVRAKALFVSITNGKTLTGDAARLGFHLARVLEAIDGEGKYLFRD